MFVRGIAMEIFVLHEAGEMAELRQITPEEIDLVHQAQDARDLAFAAEDARKDFPRRFGITKLACDEAEPAAERIGQFRAQLQLAFLRVLERLHQLLRMLGERVADRSRAVARRG